MTLKEIISTLREELGVLPLVGSPYQLLSLAQESIVSVAEWNFMRTESEIQTIAPYSTGTVSVTKGSATVTGSGTVIAVSHVGKEFQLAGDSERYTISARASDTEFTLDRVYVGDTASGGTYKIFDLFYALPSDCAEVQSIYGTASALELTAVTPKVLSHELHVDNYGIGDPTYYSIFGLDSNSLKKLFLQPIADSNAILYVDYRKMATDLTAETSTITLPSEFHRLFVAKAYVMALQRAQAHGHAVSPERIVFATQDYMMLLDGKARFANPSGNEVVAMTPQVGWTNG